MRIRLKPIADFTLARRARFQVLEIAKQLLAGLKDSYEMRMERYW
jgi:hypothetical protein